MKEKLDEWGAKFSAFKAEFMMKVAGFIFQNHTNPVLNSASKLAGWLNKKRYGSDTLDFLEHEESIDIMDDSHYEKDEKKTSN